MARKFKLQFIVQSNKCVILSERSESKDPGTNFTANVIKVRRFFDFATFGGFAQNDIREYLKLHFLLVTVYHTSFQFST